MTRITIHHLRALTASINREMGESLYYWKDSAERVAAVGHFCIDQSYGGYSLRRLCSTSGGAEDVFRCGNIPARNLHERMAAYLNGIQDLKRQQQRSICNGTT